MAPRVPAKEDHVSHHGHPWLLQIHGAAGYSSESTIERLYRDVRLYPIWEGTSQIQRIIISRELLRGPR